MLSNFRLLSGVSAAVIILSFVTIVSVEPVQAAAPKNAQANPVRTILQDDFVLTGQFLKFWNANGGLPVFGYPIEVQKKAKGQTFQWLERNRFELHTENKPPYNVLLGLLGVEFLNRHGIDWQKLPKVLSAGEGCLLFKETGHTLCGDFLNYWQTHGLEFDNIIGKSYGESLALFGFPITEPKIETNSSGDTVLTQWFERARMELHPENQDPYRVLLGRLGAEINSISS